MQFDEFLGIIDLLKSPDKYSAQIKELTARNDAIQASIKTLGIVGDLDKIKKQTTALLEKAEGVLSKAESEAIAIVAGARTAYDKKFDELKEREVKADQHLADYTSMKNSFAVRSDELRKAEKAVEQAQIQLSADRADLASKQAEVEQRLAKLRDVMG